MTTNRKQTDIFFWPYLQILQRPFFIQILTALNIWLFTANGTLTHNNGDLILGQSRKRRANIMPASGQHHMCIY